MIDLMTRQDQRLSHFGNIFDVYMRQSCKFVILGKL